MIPKIIHYCWFGRKPLPESAKKCMASWRKYLPDYEIVEWNEDNFDVNAIPYTAQAYSVGKYAFVSDYARFKILYEHGGLYFDTDVEVIRPMDDIIAAGPFMGVEVGVCNAKGYRCYNETLVAPGLGMCARPAMKLYSDVLDHYSNERFLVGREQSTKTVGEHTTLILKKSGLKHSPDIQTINDIIIYPMDWMNPLDDATGKLRITENTISIHWYTKSWIDNQSSLKTWLSRRFHRVFGINMIPNLKRIINLK